MSLELLNLDNGYAVFSKSDYTTVKHSHYAIEVILCTEGSFNITTNLSAHTKIKSAIIPPNIAHSFSCENATCSLLFLDPLSDVGKYFIQQYNLPSQKDVIVYPSELNLFHKNGKYDISLILSRAKTSGHRDFDFRILNCVNAINSVNSDYKVTLSQLSKISFLSESGLSHLFKKQLGISVHQYILWKKIWVAVSKSREGYSLTESAHFAGFSDSSHFNKVFYKMFGINPYFALKS